MHFVYGSCKGNAAAAEREYRTIFPQRRHPRRRVFEALHRRMGETGMLQPSHHVGRPSINLNAKEAILDIVEANPGISTRRLGRRVGRPHSFVWRVHQHGLYPYHLHPVQELKPENHRPRRTYCRWYYK